MKGPGGRMDPRIKGLVTPVGGGRGGGERGREGGVTSRKWVEGELFSGKVSTFLLRMTEIR